MNVADTWGQDVDACSEEVFNFLGGSEQGCSYVRPLLLG
jgi:hypothetical protein